MKCNTYPEPGKWVTQLPKGMAASEPPEVLPDTKLSALEIRELVAHEGLGFCIYEYISSQRISDKELALMWRKTRQSLQEIVDYLANLSPENTKKKVVYNKARRGKYKPKPLTLGKKL